jgi:hypothetical protein
MYLTLNKFKILNDAKHLYLLFNYVFLCSENILRIKSVNAFLIEYSKLDIQYYFQGHLK